MAKLTPAFVERQLTVYNAVLSAQELKTLYPSMGKTQLRQHRRSALRSLASHRDCGSIYHWAERAIRELLS